MEYDEEQLVNPALKKTPSEASFGSVELHIPRRRGDGGSGGGAGGNAGPGIMMDKECLSMKSDCGMDNRRRFSLVNATGKKVPICFRSVSLHRTKHINRAASNVDAAAETESQEI